MDKIEIEQAVDAAIREVLFERLDGYVPAWMFHDIGIRAVIRRSVAECIDSQRFGLLDAAMVRRIVEGEFENMMVE